MSSGAGHRYNFYSLFSIQKKNLSLHAASWRWLLPEWSRHITLAKGLNMCLNRDFYIFPCKRKRKNFRKIIISKSKFVFYGCKMFRWLQDYHSFQPCANTASLYRMFNSAVSAYRRKSQAHGRLLVWEKAELLMFKTS
jgi:hypothetical protein